VITPPGEDAADLRARIGRGEGIHVIAAELGGELHGFDLTLVEEVVSGALVHAVPDLPPALLGVTFLRGEAIPVVDIAAALGVERAAGPGALLVVGLGETRAAVAVERPGEVVEIAPGAVDPPPRMAGEGERFLLGVVRRPGGLVNLIDLAGLLRERATPERREEP
jgi:chemotaxis signal transduction protein